MVDDDGASCRSVATRSRCMSLLSPYLPEDFDSFWAEAAQEARDAPLDFHRAPQHDVVLAGFNIERIAFRSVLGTALYGWIAYPPHSRRLPSFVWIPPYGRESLLPNAYGTRQGMTSLSFNFHGEDAFHQEPYVPARGYFSEGAGDPETWIFRSMLQNCLIAARVLEAQVEADEDRIGAMGLSQGAGLAIWTGAFSNVVKAVCADMPFLSAMRQTFSLPIYRYPLKELTDFMDTIPIGRERVMNTVSYFDTVNMATHCAKPTQVSLGLKDPSCRPQNVEAVFEALPAKKNLIKYDWGHDWGLPMIENNRRWLLENL